MMELRPMVINNDNVVLGGNMRLKALKELGYKDIPDAWVKRASELTDDEQRRFIIADNVGFGEHDWEMLANQWDVEELSEWGLDIPDWGEEEVKEKEQVDLSDDLKETFEVIISCTDETHQEQVFNKMIADGFEARVLTL